MPGSSRVCPLCTRDQDGIIMGKHQPPPCSGRTTLTSLFESELHHHHRIALTKTAVVFSPAELTFGELDHYSNAVAVEIQKHVGHSLDKITNPDQEILIAVCLPISERLIPLIFAILKLGAAFLPLDPKYPEDLLLAIINKFRPIMVITDDNGPILGKYDAKQFADYSKLMSIEEIWLDMEVPLMDTPEGGIQTRELRKKIEVFESPVPTPPHERPALVVHTTGVCGNPRGVRVPHSSILNRVCWEWREIPHSKKDICALTCPIASVDAFNQIFSSLLKGLTLHIFKRNEYHNMSNFIYKIVDRHLTRLYFTPSLLHSFIKECETMGKDSSELEHVKVVLCTGDLIPTHVARNFLSFFDTGAVILINIFGGGPEGGGDMMYTRFKNEKDLDKKILLDKILLARVVDNFVVYILSNYLELVTKDDTQGEICISGTMSMGYVDMKEEKELYHKFVDNPHDDRPNFRKLFRTGDYGRLVSRNGKKYIYIEGRLDTRVNIKGHDVNMDEIQDLILMNDTVEETFLQIYHPGRVDQALLGFVFPKATVRQSLMADEVEGRLSSKIPEYLVPAIKIIEQVPMVGKHVCQHCLLRLYENDKTSKFNNWGKVRLTNEKLATCKLLVEAMYKFASIDIEFAVSSLSESFYSLGGTSLNTLSVVLYINRSGCPINLGEFLKASSLNDIINLMSQRMGQNIREKLQNLQQQQQGTFTTMVTASTTMSTIFDDVDVDSLQEFDVTIIPATSNIRKEAISLLSKAYAEKGELGRYDYVKYNEFYNYFTQVWDTFVEQQLSTIVTRKSDGKMVACCLCQDFYTPSTNMTKAKSMHHLLEYAQELKGTVLNSVPHLKNSMFEISWLATSTVLSPMDNVRIVLMLMNENQKHAKIDGYTSLFCATTNPLMRELCLDVLNYQLLDNYTARNFQEKVGFHPFRCAPLTMTSTLCWLVIGPIPSQISSVDQSVISSLLEESIQKNIKTNKNSTKFTTK